MRKLVIDHSLRGASPLGLPYTLSREPLRRLAPVAWLASLRSLASCYEQQILPNTLRCARSRLLSHSLVSLDRFFTSFASYHSRLFPLSLASSFALVSSFRFPVTSSFPH